MSLNMPLRPTIIPQSTQPPGEINFSSPRLQFKLFNINCAGFAAAKIANSRVYCQQVEIVRSQKSKYRVGRRQIAVSGHAH